MMTKRDRMDTGNPKDEVYNSKIQTTKFKRGNSV